jgi:hypothetical protein
MRAGRWVKVLDPYDWLPGYGESSVTLHAEGLELLVGVSYDADGEATQCRTLHFDKVCAFYKASFPGPYLLGIARDGQGEAPPLGTLLEYPDSEAAARWRDHLGGRMVRHYQLVFLAENILLEVFAGGVTISDAAPSGS